MLLLAVLLLMTLLLLLLLMFVVRLRKQLQGLMDNAFQGIWRRVRTPKWIVLGKF